jgi:hypothetical protein
MSNVQFEEDRAGLVPQGGEVDRHRGLIGFLLNHGIVRTDTQALFTLVGVLVITLGLTGFILVKNSKPSYMPIPEGYRVVSKPGSPPTLEKIR